MTESENEIIINQTKKWITDVVVGCNFCPFAAKEVKKQSIHYEVLADATTKSTLVAVIKVLQQLRDNDAIETSFLILPGSFGVFTAYLDLVEITESLIEKENLEGIFQVAGFHPEYLFAGTTADDPSNYTNRSPFPMLHFLREETVSKAVDSYPGINEIPKQNIAYTKEKGLAHMQELLRKAKE
jgi:hypothetical protein